MNSDSLIDKLLARAGQLVGLASPGARADRPRTEIIADQVGTVAEQGIRTKLAAERRDLTYQVGPSLVRVRLYLQPSDDSAAARPRVTHAEVLLPALGGGEPQRVMLRNEHWRMIAQVLPRRKPAATSAPGPADKLIPNTALDADSVLEHTAPLITPPIAAGAGSRLYLLDHQRLYEWATIHWKSLPEIEAVCDAFFHNWKAWRLEHRNDWYVADHFFACHKRLNTLRRRAVRTQGELTDEAAPSPGPEDATEPSEDAPDECLPYTRLLEDVLLSWNDRDALMAQAEELRTMLRQGMPTLPSELRPRLILELIEMRLHALLPLIPVVREKKKPASAGAISPHSLPPGCPEWPAEAEHGALQALNSESFFHATGMLKFMGYGVGRKAALSADRRRAILAYVFMGRLPPVNDSHYMQEWGRPKSNRRLRKLANSLAAFARNARRKKSSSWNHAIANWEADLAHLKKRYYDRRLRDWKWPETVRRSGR